jgi:hypothetical protein
MFGVTTALDRALAPPFLIVGSARQCGIELSLRPAAGARGEGGGGGGGDLASVELERLCHGSGEGARHGSLNPLDTLLHGVYLGLNRTELGANLPRFAL